jgi:hypothetical protein
VPAPTPALNAPAWPLKPPRKRRRAHLHQGEKKVENRHSEPAAAGEESLLVFSVELGGIRRFARNNNDERTRFGTRSAAEVMQAIFLTIFCASEKKGSA